ncbi:alpha/beta fold hydrolase [Candidatus Bipolaricaulota bacterium]|nr:alpha/beta fold hydrolase [Candidatus Bipolaricaulota bacterium]
MSNKMWLLGLLAIAVLAGLLLGGRTAEEAVGPSEVVQEENADQRKVDEATWITEVGGTPIVEESYTLLYSDIEGYLLLSQVSLHSGAADVSIGQQYLLDQAFLPISYQIASEGAGVEQVIWGQTRVEGFAMTVKIGEVQQSATVPMNGGFVVIDNNFMSHLVLLHAGIRAGLIPTTFSAAIPQALLALPSSVGDPQPTRIAVEGGMRDVISYALQFGDFSMTLYEMDGRLVGMANPAQRVVAYDAGVLPEGFERIASGETEAATPVSGLEQEILFDSGDVRLAGTLAVPAEPNGAAVLFVHGSGPLDRNSNAVDLATGDVVMELGLFDRLAEELAAQGVASLRYDKRGVGQSEGVLPLASRETLLADAEAALSVLRGMSWIHPERLFLIGHSEGAYLVAELAAVERDPALGGMVLLAGGASGLDEITLRQVETLLRAQGGTQQQVDLALEQEGIYLDFVRNSSGEWRDYTIESLRAELPFMSDEQIGALSGGVVGLSWLRQHYLADSEAILGLVRIPVLTINGDKDLQVPVEESDRLHDILSEAGVADLTSVKVEDLNHLMRYHPEEPNLTYRHLDSPIDPRIVDLVTEWVVARSD